VDKVSEVTVRIGDMTSTRRVVSSPVGTWCLEGTEEGLTKVWMPFESPRRDAGPACEVVDRAAAQLEQYFAGQRTTFEVLLAPVSATAFQVACWSALRDIPFGSVATYADIAMAIGSPRAARAVGNANHNNPWPIIVPCHRVVAAHGLGGYGGGVEVKSFLLEREGVDCANY